MKLYLVILICLSTHFAQAQRYPLAQQNRDLLCYQTLTENRKIQAWDGNYISDGKNSNVLDELNAAITRINSNPLASQDQKKALEDLKSQFANYYQCDGAGNPIPERRRNTTLEQTLQQYDHLCLLTKDGIKRMSIESYRELVKDLSGLPAIPVAWVYNNYIKLAMYSFNTKAKMDSIGAADQTRIESVIYQRGNPKSNLTLNAEQQQVVRLNCPDSYVNSGPAVVREPVRTSPTAPAGIRRSRPGSR